MGQENLPKPILLPLLSIQSHAAFLYSFGVNIAKWCKRPGYPDISISIYIAEFSCILLLFAVNSFVVILL